MLTRVILVATIAATAVFGGPVADEMFFGTWHDDANPNAFIVFSPDHSIVVRAGTPLTTFIEGRWRVAGDELFLSEGKAAGKPLPEAECRQKILSVGSDKIVFQGSAANDKDVLTYTRVR
jgi:hypothetical protein